MPQAATLAQHSTAQHSGIIASIFNFIDCFLTIRQKDHHTILADGFSFFSEKLTTSKDKPLNKGDLPIGEAHNGKNQHDANVSYKGG